jgi:DNA mismatch repair ATPase MutS
MFGRFLQRGEPCPFIVMRMGLPVLECQPDRDPLHLLINSPELNIINGRHPSVEASLLTSARAFTPNNTIMSPETHLHIITGPNQGGKSTLLRQNAIIAILAQSGCFVPADSAVIGVVDKVFSRVGARDDLYRDRSTFMLEMVE